MTFTKRIYYCRKCDKAYIKSMFEKKNCDYCRGECRELDVPYSGYTLAAWVILIACLIPLVAYRDMSDMERYSILVGAIIAAFVLAGIGVGKMKAKAEEMGRDHKKDSHGGKLSKKSRR